jgi:uncharacterized protein YjbI with pentapeptide repeats
VADDGGQQRKPDFRRVVADAKLLATGLAEEAESVLGRRTARILGVVALSAVVVALLLVLLNWFISPNTAQERQGLAVVLAISLGGIAAIVGLYFTRQLEADRVREAALRGCLEQLGGLITQKEWSTRDKKGETDDTLRNLARAQAVSVLGTLDGARKRILIRFLYESRLLDKDTPAIDLNRADLRDADLSDLTLSNASFSGVRLMGADLSGANLSEANLSEANLSEANLSGANLKGAVGITNEELEQQALSLEGATLPDGSKHD